MRVMPKKLPGQSAQEADGGRAETCRRSAAGRMRDKMPWLPYVLPLVVFLLLTGLEETFQAIYPLFYAVKIALVTGVLVVLWRFLPEAHPQRDGAGAGGGDGRAAGVRVGDR